MNTFRFNYDSSWPNVLGSAIVAVVAISLAWVACKRSKGAARVRILELFRILLIGMAMATLWQPEWTRSIQPKNKATIAILYDVSSSMRTQDASGTIEGQERSSRMQAIQSLASKEAWKAPDENTEFVLESFSSADGSDSGTDIHDAMQKCLDRHPDLRAVVLASDGDWNVGVSPNAAAAQMRLRNIPVHTLAVGSQQRLPDLGIASFDVPTFAVVGKPLRIPFSISSTMNADKDVNVELLVGEQRIDEQLVRVPAAGVGKGTMEWRPKHVGDEKLTIRFVPEASDSVADNNEQSVGIVMRQEALRVLLIESSPRWEYRYTRNALERDPGVDVDCYLLHPEFGELGGGRGYVDSFPTDEQLANYDVIFLGDVGLGPNGLSMEECNKIRKAVESQASGLVLLPGMKGNQTSLMQTAIADLFPVDLDVQQMRGVGASRPGQFQLTDAGRSSLLTRLESSDANNDEVWRSLPGFYWYAAVDRVRPGSQVLATHDRDATRTGRVPLIVTKTFGNGKILFMGSDGAWRWRKGVEDRYHYRFWGQVVRWMAYQRTMSDGGSMRLFYSPDRPKQGDSITLQANVMSASGEPLQTGTVATQIVAPSGRTASIAFQRASEDSWGLFTANFRPSEAGDHQLTTRCVETGASLESVVSVAGVQRERVGMPARLDVLKEISHITRGQCMSIDDLDKLVDHLEKMPPPAAIESRLQLWCHPGWGVAMIALLGLFWTSRKFAGMV
jgi:hypothetical protein